MTHQGLSVFVISLICAACVVALHLFLGPFVGIELVMFWFAAVWLWLGIGVATAWAMPSLLKVRLCPPAAVSLYFGPVVWVIVLFGSLVYFGLIKPLSWLSRFFPLPKE